MPYKANEARRNKIPRARYRVTNWPEYDRALQQRGSLTVWVTPEALAAWHPPKTGRPGRSRTYSDIAIETGHLLRLAFSRPWRQTEGLLRSLAERRCLASNLSERAAAAPFTERRSSRQGRGRSR
jgi:Transposase DDE domain